MCQLLDEQEWQQVVPLLRDGVETIKQYRLENDVGLTDAKDAVYGQAALAKYFEITGYNETNANALWHHRLSRFGPPCKACGKPLRTPRAKLCAECGTPRNGGG
jgi:hypothetical protein